MIKHEIRWEYILVICIILGTLPCNAQSVIPMPKEMVMGEGSWGCICRYTYKLQ